MKNVTKAMMMLLLLFGVGVGGFFLGTNSQLSPSGAADEGDVAEEKRILQNIEAYKSVIDQDFLFDVNKTDLENGIYKGLFEGLKDPYSVYYTPEEYKRLMEDTSGHFAGVGLVISAGEDGLITVVSAIDDTPAAQAGLKTGDKILAVDAVEYTADQLQEATDHMRGKIGTEVTVTVRRQDGDTVETKDYTIKRAEINVASVTSKMMQDNVGYIRISEFAEETAAQFKEQIQELEKQGAQRIVLDLRNNPGGLITTSEEVADYLLGEGKIVTTVDKKGKEEVSSSDAENDPIPMVVLINNGSASASEILMGALRDHNRAKSVGVKSYGKGIVQRIYPLGANGEQGGFKLTMAEYLTPNGEKIHKKGIEPDVPVELNKDAKAIGPEALDQDNQLEKAIEEVKAID